MVFFSLKALFPTPTMEATARANAAAAFPDDVVQLLRQLMSIPSTTGEEGDAVDYLVTGLHADGWFVQRQSVGGNRGRANVYATRAPAGERAPRLVFNSHIDTVPPHVDYSEDGENVYGRGSCDAKGQVAAMILAARHLISHSPSLAADIGLLIVVGEETDHVGMIKANDLPGFAPEFLIVGEPTEMKFATIQKGACKVKLSVAGKAGHSEYPHAGVSAIHKLIEILNDIMEYEWPKDEKQGDTTFNIGTISGGQALNAWAEKAEAAVFFRVTTSYADVKRRVEEIVNGRAEIDYSLGGFEMSDGKTLKEARERLNKLPDKAEKTIKQIGDNHAKCENLMANIRKTINKFASDKKSKKMTIEEERQRAAEIDKMYAEAESLARKKVNLASGLYDYIDKEIRGMDQIKENQTDTEVESGNNEDAAADYVPMPIDPEEPVYCTCKQVQSDMMVGCDNTECPNGEWFHFHCVGLTVAPPENVKWFCEGCRPNFKKVNNQWNYDTNEPPKKKK